MSRRGEGARVERGSTTGSGRRAGRPSTTGSGGRAGRPSTTGSGGCAGAAVLAADVGNSKTDLALVTADGHVLSTARGPTASHQAVGLDAAMRALDALASRAAASAGLPVTRPLADVAVLCMAGADLPEDVRLLRGAARGLGLAAREEIRNDTEAVLRAGTAEGWGVAVVCGAGINCIGRAPDGRTVRFAALGEISGDWGGGRAVGMAGLAAAIRGRDGRGPRTALERLVPAHFGLRRPDAVTRALYLGRIDEDRVLELAPLVFRAAADGDAVAGSIVDRLADEVVAMAGAAIGRLRLARRSPAVVLGGGVFLGGDVRLLARIEEGIAAIAPTARLVPLDVPPLLGAALLGLDAVGASDDARDRLRRELPG